MVARLDHRSPSTDRQAWPAMLMTFLGLLVGVIFAVSGYVLGIALILLLPFVVLAVAVVSILDRKRFRGRVQKLAAQAEWFEDRGEVVGASTVAHIKYEGRPFAVEVSEQTGQCPLGLDQGDAWTVSGQGNVSSPVCQPAAAAMSRIVSVGPGAGTSAFCECPLGRNSVRFRANYV